MRLNHKQLINLPVYTKRKDYLGRVSGFEINSEEHIILKYFVTKSTLVKELLGSLGASYDLEVASAQVINISEEKMIVEDNVAKDIKKIQQSIKQSTPATVSYSNSNFSD